MTELSIVIGMDLETCSRIGFTIHIEAGERPPRSVTNWLLSLMNISAENARCLMGYIVNLTVILDEIFKTTNGSVTKNAVLEVINTHIKSGRRNRIHFDIRNFVAETFPNKFTTEKDLVLENIISLIRRYCVPPNS
jgi:hypothetical protein